MEAPGSEENAARFGCAGKKERCSFPYVQMAALAECGTHAIVAAAMGRKGEGEETLASRILAGGAVGAGMIVMVDAGLYSYQNLSAVTGAGADAIFRVGANVGLPALEWLPGGSYRSFTADPDAKREICTGCAGGWWRSLTCREFVCVPSITRSRAGGMAARL